MEKTFWKAIAFFIFFMLALAITASIAQEISNFNKDSHWSARIINATMIMVWQYFQFRLFIIFYEYKDDKPKEETEDGE